MNKCTLPRFAVVGLLGIIYGANSVAQAGNYYVLWNVAGINCIGYGDAPGKGSSEMGGALKNVIDMSVANHAARPNSCPPILSLDLVGDIEYSPVGSFSYRQKVSGIYGLEPGDGNLRPTGFTDYVYIRGKPVVDRYHGKNLCEAGFGNPIYPFIGAKRNTLNLAVWLGDSFQLGYDSSSMVQANAPEAVFLGAKVTNFGPLWEGGWSRKLLFQGGSARGIQVARGSGKWISFAFDGTKYVADSDTSDRLVAIDGGYRYSDLTRGVHEVYNSVGQLISIGSASGSRWSYTYSTNATPVAVAPVPGLMIQVQDQTGRSVQFVYEMPIIPGKYPRIKQIIDPSGQKLTFGYNQIGNLAKVVYPDGQAKKFVYEDPSLTWALTGQIDEDEKRISTYSYDSGGYSIGTQSAGAAGLYGASWSAKPTWNIVDTIDSNSNVVWRDHYWVNPVGTQLTTPNGQLINLESILVNGTPRLASQSQPAGSGCSASSSAMAYDANSNVIQRDDFNGSRSCSAFDLSRNLETSRVDGLSSSSSCAGLLTSGAPLPASSRKTSSQWHPDWRLSTKVAEPLRLTTSVYNGQPDPFSGGTASCAPPNGVLSDGKPIAVLCKKVEQATTDINGSQGFAAVPQGGVLARTWQYSYNEFGQVLSVTDPLGNVTRYSYYSDTTSSHTQGDLRSVTNPLGQVIQFSLYNASGQALQMVDPNGVATDYQYDSRQRLTLVTTAGASTAYDYWPTGLLKQVTQPDASFVSYAYDDARRLIAISDGLGNRIDYTLDNSGNRTAEHFTDPNGNLARQVSRVMDALNRVQQATGRE
ncbi:MAG: hypothetical protein K2W93_15145 [Burkholderiaceae bacterium]|nr:hypothetical protein [Burkholderiaceae bacterium]